MKIVVLDGYTMQLGEEEWGRLHAYGEVVYYDRTDLDQIVDRSAGADVIFTNKVPLTAEVLSQLPDLRFISVLATGYNMVDLQAARSRDISVSNVPVYGTGSVAQHTTALILELSNHVGLHSQAVREGEWSRQSDWTFWKSENRELSGQTIGIVGFGRIGRRVGEIVHALGMTIWAADVLQVDPPDYDGFAWKSITEVFAGADWITLHCPLLPDNEGFVNLALLETMKPTAFLVNAARGPLVVDRDLAEALNRGLLAGAALDVVTQEPIAADNPLLSAQNCIVTPHMAWASNLARPSLLATAIGNVCSFLEGKPENVVN